MLKNTYDKTHRRNAPPHLYLPTITIMKSILISATLIIIAHLFLGYYTDQGVHGGDIVFFIKKHPTLQMRFKNLYTRDGDYTPLEKMNMGEANIIIDYCRYRLGINTRLTTQEELEACKAR